VYYSPIWRSKIENFIKNWNAKHVPSGAQGLSKKKGKLRLPCRLVHIQKIKFKQRIQTSHTKFRLHVETYSMNRNNRNRNKPSSVMLCVKSSSITSEISWNFTVCLYYWLALKQKYIPDYKWMSPLLHIWQLFANKLEYDARLTHILTSHVLSRLTQ